MVSAASDREMGEAVGQRQGRHREDADGDRREQQIGEEQHRGPVTDGERDDYRLSGPNAREHDSKRRIAAEADEPCTKPA